MHIDTKKTVEKTFSQYRWDDLENWTQNGSLSTRQIYKDEGLIIYQQINDTNRQVIFETPEYTMRISTGSRRNLMYDSNENVRYYALNVETTMNERNVYHSLIDNAEYREIKGERRHILNFEKILPPKYFILEKDENARHISTYWMRIPRSIFSNRSKRSTLSKERE